MYACAFVKLLLLVYQLFEGLVELAIYFTILKRYDRLLRNHLAAERNLILTGDTPWLGSVISA